MNDVIFELGFSGYVKNYTESPKKSLLLIAEILRASGVEVANYE